VLALILKAFFVNHRQQGRMKMATKKAAKKPVAKKAAKKSCCAKKK